MKMKTIFNVKKITICALIFILALSIPLTVSAKTDGGNQGNSGNSGNSSQEKREKTKDEVNDKENFEAVSDSVDSIENEEVDESRNVSDEEIDEPEKDAKDADQNRGQQQKEMQQERKELKDQLKEAKNLHKDMSKEARSELRTQAEQQVTLLEAEGNLDEALEVQTELVQLELKNKGAYKKLGHLHDKVTGKKAIKVFVNGSHPVFDFPPVIRDGRTLIPLRAVSNALNADVDWDAEEKKVTISRDGVIMELYIGEATAYINGEEISLDVPANVENSRTFVPIRFISEAFNAYVDWEEETGSVIIVDESEAAIEETEGTEEEATEDTDGTEEEAATEETEGTEEEAAIEETDGTEDEETTVETVEEEIVTDGTDGEEVEENINEI